MVISSIIPIGVGEGKGVEVDSTSASAVVDDTATYSKKDTACLKGQYNEN